MKEIVWDSFNWDKGNATFVVGRFKDDEIIKLRDLEDVSSIVVTHQLRDAFYVATPQAVRENGAVRIVPAEADKSEEAEFMMLRGGLIVFEGTAAQLRAAGDPYLRNFLS